MARKTRIAVPKQLDPAEVANQEVLRQRQERIEANRRVTPVLDLGLEEKQPGTAFQFLGDEWDRKAHGDPVATIRKTIYGPHPLIDNFPEMRAAIEKAGKVDFADATYEALMTKGAAAFSDPLMARQIQRGINKFGKQTLAEAFRDRILEIPTREVEIDASDMLDPEIMGSNILHETVRRYERQGMAYKFLSQRCIDVMGMRGYTFVKDPQTGDTVRAGTLLLGEIRQEIADARKQRAVKESLDYVREIEEDYRASLAGPDPDFNYRGARAEGVTVMGEGDSITVGASDREENVGEQRRGGFRIERQERTQRVERRNAA